MSHLFALNFIVEQFCLTDKLDPIRVNLGAMTMKEYSAFPKAPSLLDQHHQIV